MWGGFEKSLKNFNLTVAPNTHEHDHFINIDDFSKYFFSADILSSIFFSLTEIFTEMFGK